MSAEKWMIECPGRTSAVHSHLILPAPAVFHGLMTRNGRNGRRKSLTTTPPIPFGNNLSAFPNRFNIRSSIFKTSLSPPYSLSSSASSSSFAPYTFLSGVEAAFGLPGVHCPLRGVLVPFVDVDVGPPFRYPFLSDSWIAPAHHVVFASYPVGLDSF